MEKITLIYVHEIYTKPAVTCRASSFSTYFEDEVYSTLDLKILIR